MTQGPYLRVAPPEDAPPNPCPDGHATHPAGIWMGEHMEVVYDPTRHDVALLREGVSVEVARGMRATGWERRLVDGRNEMWVRDRAALARQRLEQIRTTPAAPRIA